MFDGPDGSGKSTLMKKVINKIEIELPDYNILKTKEPGGTDIGQGIRKLLLDPKYSPSKKTELMLFIADRAEHYSKVLKPKLKESKNIVVSDRYWESTLVYQLIEGNIELEIIKYLHEFITDNLFPDLFFIIDSNYPHDLKGDRIDQKGNEFRNKIRHEYYK
ncbi:MAG: dTMP kinase, partial [bacterium]